MKCINCGGMLRYDPSTYGLLCDHCGFKKILHRPEEQVVVEEKDFDSAMRDAVYDWGVMRREVRCKVCGAVTFYDPNMISTTCPYCGSNDVLTASETNAGIAPSAVIPFKISKQEAVDFFYKWNKWALWCPEEFRKGRFLENYTGVYVPYWTFDAESVTTYSGKFGYERGSGDSTYTKWENRSGVVQESFNDRPICGSRKFLNNPLITKSIVTLNPKDIVPYNPEALMGFAAEKYSIGIDEAWNMVKGNLNRDHMYAACKNEFADSYDKNIQMSTEYSNIRFKYVLVPLWISACRYKGKVYNVVCSGSELRGNCNRPVSVAKIVALCIGVVGIITLPVVLYSLLIIIMNLARLF